jgi:hypothetical protein
MRLYTRTGATALDDTEHGHFEASPDGAFDLPEELAEHLRTFHIGGRPAWETDVERQRRLISEELERRKDPATLLSAVEQIMEAARAATAATATATPATKTRAAKRAAGTAPADAG